MNIIRAPRCLLLAGLTLAMTMTWAEPAAATLSTRAEGLRRHAKLLKSNPAANDTLTVSPAAIRLWFSEPVTLGLSRIKLVGSRGTIVTGTATHLRGGDAASLEETVRAPLPVGTYTVQWIVASPDGHALRGSYTFTVIQRP